MGSGSFAFAGTGEPAVIYPVYYFVDMLQARKIGRKIEQRVSTRSTSIFACSMHDIRARARVIHS